MQPSRDDFIIAIRSAFLKKGNKQRFSLIALLFFSIILITLGKFNLSAINYLKAGINEVIYRSSFVVSIPEKYLDHSSSSIKEHLNLYKNYKIIKKNYEKILSKNYDVEFLKAENQRLKKILDDISYLSESKISKVLVDKQSPFFRSIVINKGSKNGIEKGMAILKDSYLAGKVVEVNYMTSRVLLLSDLNSKIPVTIEPGGIQAILSGNGKNSGLIQYQKSKFPIENGSIVYTSGTGGLFKAGIPIGKTNYIASQNNVNFFIDFTQLRFIRILSFKESKQD